MTNDMEKATKQLIEVVLDNLCEYPDRAKCDVQSKNNACLITVSVDPSDYGKVIGQQGRIAKGLRSILQAFAGKFRTKFLFEIVSNGDTR